MQLWDLVVHKLRINTHWEDYYRYGFYDQAKSWAEKSLYIGEFGSKYWPWETNSRKFDSLFVRKSLQKSIAVDNGLPTPRLLMKVGKYYPINNRETFIEAFGKISEPFILKIDGGMQGNAIHLFEPAKNGFLHKGEVVSADWIWDRFEKNLEPGYIIEERVSNHPDIASIYPRSLNTLRLVTIRTRDGKQHLLPPYIKFGSGGSHVDNLSAGGLFAVIDENGRLGIGMDELGNRYDVHPDTGEQITGRAVPHVDEALELALEASRVFGFMGTLGWDIGITPDGPVIIEGNTRWGADKYQEQVGPCLTKEIADGLMPRSWWSPWDKTHIYPQHIYKMNGGWWQQHLAKRRNRWNAGALTPEKSPT